MFFIFSNKAKIKEKILANNYYEKTFNWDSSKRFSAIYSSCVNKIGLIPECFFKDKDNEVLFYLEGNSFMGNFLEMFENSDVIKNAYYKHYHGYNLNSSNFVRSTIPNFTGTNQSKGHKAANNFLSVVPKHLPATYSITSAEGGGYPDRIFNIGNVGFCMELKATSNWDDKDANRRVLTSTPVKMQKLVSTN